MDPGYELKRPVEHSRHPREVQQEDHTNAILTSLRQDTKTTLQRQKQTTTILKLNQSKHQIERAEASNKGRAGEAALADITTLEGSLEAFKIHGPFEAQSYLINPG